MKIEDETDFEIADERPNLGFGDIIYLINVA
jgi:hypothetical protein